MTKSDKSQLYAANVGDVCVYDKHERKLFIVSVSDFIGNGFSKSRYSPVGVVVIPGSHDVYGDGSCGVISLVNMTAISTSGEFVKEMCFGTAYKDNGCIDTFHWFPTIDLFGDSDGSVTNIGWCGYMCSDRFTSLMNKYDCIVGYTSVDSINHVPSPYVNEYGRNPSYFTCEFSGGTFKNALSCFDGRLNTDKILLERGSKDYRTWKPTYNSADDYPAASSCDMYYTDGTKQGDWYLPAIGELGYVMARLCIINKTIHLLNNEYNLFEEIGIYEYEFLISSTKSGKDYQWIVRTNNGNLLASGHIHGRNYVRAFMKLGAKSYHHL